MSGQGGGGAGGAGMSQGGNASAGTSNAGAGNQGGGGPHEVTSCDNLGGVGIWQEISPSAFHDPSNRETTCVAFDPATQAVFASASNKTNGGDGGTGVYRAPDCGATWSKLSTRPELDTGLCFGLVVDPVTPENLYYANGYGDNPTLWKSTDGGVEWQPLEIDPDSATGGFADKYAMDPTNPQHLVLTFHGPCSGQYGPQCLSETTDGGSSWRLVKGPDSGWVEGNRVAVIGGGSWLYLSGNGGWFTANGGQTWEQVICWDAMPGCLAVGNAPSEVFVDPSGQSAYVTVGSSGVIESHPQTDPSLLLGRSWSKIEGSPESFGVVSDGASLFVTHDYADQPFWTASLGAITTWTHMDSPNIGRRSDRFVYDPDHHLLYSANLAGGLWRLKTQ